MRGCWSSIAVCSNLGIAKAGASWSQPSCQWDTTRKTTRVDTASLPAVLVFGVGLVHGWWWGLLKCCWSSIAICGNLGKASVQAAGAASAKAASNATKRVAASSAKAEKGPRSKVAAADQLDSDLEDDSPPARPKKGMQ